MGFVSAEEKRWVRSWDIVLSGVPPQPRGLLRGRNCSWEPDSARKRSRHGRSIIHSEPTWRRVLSHTSMFQMSFFLPNIYFIHQKSSRPISCEPRQVYAFARDRFPFFDSVLLLWSAFLIQVDQLLGFSFVCSGLPSSGKAMRCAWLRYLEYLDDDTPLNS